MPGAGNPLIVREVDLDALILQAGSHPADGTSGPYCVMEAAAYVAGEKHTDHPACVSPAIAAFMRAWNDALSDQDRQKLKPYIFRLLDRMIDVGRTEESLLVTRDEA